MKLVPQSLAGRLVLALLAAAAAVALLDVAVTKGDARAAARDPTRRVAPAAAPPIVGLLPTLGEILLAIRLDAVPADAAPVVQITPNGAFTVLRPSPREPAGAVLRPAAILLPTASLGRFDATARATFAEVVARLATERPVRGARFRALGFRLETADLERVLAWLP